MNFQLNLPGKKKGKSKKTLAGLNRRDGHKTPKNVFGAGDSDDDDEVHLSKSTSGSSYRDNVNRAIKKEQDAMRKRAEQSMKRAAQSQEGTSIYDYDGSFESFSSQQQSTKPKKDSNGDNDKKESRYMSELLKAAKERNYERDIAYERKMARELKSEEEANIELQAKDKFITAGYKRKLEERQLWKESREKQDKEETKKGNAIANFYGNLSKNVAMGGSAEVGGKEPPSGQTENSNHVDGTRSFMDGFERSKVANDIATNESTQSARAKDTETTYIDPEQLRSERRRLRDEKVAQARERYFKRHPITSD